MTDNQDAQDEKTTRLAALAEEMRLREKFVTALGKSCVIRADGLSDKDDIMVQTARRVLREVRDDGEENVVPLFRKFGNAVQDGNLESANNLCETIRVRTRHIEPFLELARDS